MTEESQIAGTINVLETTMEPTATRTPAELADIVEGFASSPKWLERVRLRSDQRWYEKLYDGPDYDVWVISWMPGQSTGFHDHGASAGAFVVTCGVLEEHRLGERSRIVSAGELRVFSSDYAYDVRNVSTAPAISIHAYSPPLTEMNEYELVETRLVPRTNSNRESRFTYRERHTPKEKSADRSLRLNVDQVLAAARAQLHRLSPEDAYKAVAKTGAVLVDIRPDSQRDAEGTIVGALIVERNVLEWRFDPASSSRLSVANNHELPVIVFCSEGYTSSLAAAALKDLGLWRATDIVGGFKAWRAKGLPIAREE
jgi:rhodanese-related sulfurtransferase/predicted metal-dependent enzyme (double-stranded beta helix superfamily)